MGANVALIFSGQYVKWVSSLRVNLAPGVDAWGMSLKYLMGAVVACGGVMLGLFQHMQNNVMTDPNCVNQEEQAKKKSKKKVKMSLKDSAKFLMDSSYLRNLATLVVSYGMCINIVEVSWKAKLKVNFVINTMSSSRCFVLKCILKPSYQIAYVFSDHTASVP